MMFNRIVKFGSKFIDYKIGAIGALVMGAIVFGINYAGIDEIRGATTAAVKQGVYTFFLGGSFMKGCEHLATKIKGQTLAIMASVVIPSAITLLLTYNVHLLKGTPKPFQSTIPTVMIIPATAVWGTKKRKEFDSANNFEELK